MAIRLMMLAFVVATGPAIAGWTLESTKDSMTDRTKKEASVQNEAGHRFTVYRGPNEAAWATFSVATSSGDTIAPRRAPMLRVDSFAPHDLETSRTVTESNVGVRLYVWEPSFINFLVWHGKASEGRSTLLNELMSGNKVVFRYFLGTGGYKETTFSLDGAGSAIAESLGISLQADPEKEAAIQAMRGAQAIAHRGCLQQGQRAVDLKVCLDKVDVCRRQANGDVPTFEACLR